MLYTVHKISIKKSYQCYMCSTSFFISTLFTVITIIVPFILSYISQDIWRKEISCREQPSVDFKNEMLLYIKTNKNDWRWSTNNFYNEAVGENLIVPLVQYNEEDYNYDSLNDFISLQVEIPLDKREMVYSMKILLVFDYYLKCMTEIAMEGLAVVETGHIENTSKVYIQGDLSVLQRTLLPSRKKYYSLNEQILPHNSPELKNWRQENILKNYWSRNVTTRLTNVYTTEIPNINSETFTMDIRIAYSPQKILYHPSIWHVLKIAWIQYLSFYLVFYYGFQSFKTWIYKNQLCRTYVFNPLNKCN